MQLLFDYSNILLAGSWITIKVAFLSLLFSTIIGFFLALIKCYFNRFFGFFVSLYTSVVRGVPELVMMFLIFFGGQILINSITEKSNLEYIDIDAFWAGVFVLSFVYGAFMVETFRGAILSADKGQIISGRAFGFNSFKLIFHIIIPQIALHAFPSYTNNILVLLKSTAIISIIGLNDMVFVANLASRSTHKPFIFFLAISLIYLLLTSLILLIIFFFKKKYNVDYQIL